LQVWSAPLRSSYGFIWTAVRGVRTDGPMAPEIALDRQRPADYAYSRHVGTMLDKVRRKSDSIKAAESKTSILTD
jgi:hypothetical protein